MTWQSDEINPATTSPATDISKITNDLALLKSVISAGGTDVDIPGISFGYSMAVAGDLTVSGSGRRMLADLSSATHATRWLFQTSTANSQTAVGAAPSGTGTVGQFVAYNSSDPNNASIAQLQALSTDIRIVSAITGSGSYLPLTVNVGGSEAVRIAPTTRAVLVGTPTDSATAGDLLQIGDGTGQKRVTINGAGSGTSGGALLNLKNGGAPIGAVGNYSAIIGGAYDGKMAVYSASSLVLQTGSGNIIAGTTTDNTSGAKYGVLQLKETSTSGIYLGNTANSAANVLDWYEEGTFTPTVAGTSTAGSGTYSLRTASYTRIGNKVFIHINLAWTGHTGTGSLTVTGLPFASDGVQSYPLAVWFDVLFVGAGKQLSAVVGLSSTIYLSNCDVAGGAIAFTAMDTSGGLVLSGEYEV